MTVSRYVVAIAAVPALLAGRPARRAADISESVACAAFHEEGLSRRRGNGRVGPDRDLQRALDWNPQVILGIVVGVHGADCAGLQLDARDANLRAIDQACRPDARVGFTRSGGRWSLASLCCGRTGEQGVHGCDRGDVA